MEIVADLIGQDWGKLAYKLFDQDTLITKAQVIDAIKLKTDDLHNRCFEMLNKWKMESKHPTREKLIERLSELRMNAIVERLSAPPTETPSETRSSKSEYLLSI